MQVQTKTLKSELQWINRFVSCKATVPILAHALFSVDGPTLTLTATDLEDAGVTTVAGIGRQKWDVTAPIAKLIKYLDKVDESEVLLGATDNHWLTVSHGVSCTKISGMSRESYPELPAAPAPQVTLSRLPLAVGRTAFAISSEETRFTLNGALIEIVKGEAHMIATDGHRLARAPLGSKGVDSLRVLIGKFALLEAAKLDGECTLATDDNHAFLDWGQRKIVTRKLTGNFPEWERVMPKEAANHAVIPVQTTLKTLSRVALYADERSHAVKFVIADGKMTIRAESTEEGSAEGVVPIRAGRYTPLVYGLNAEYVMEFLRIIESTQVAFCWQDDDPPRADGGNVITGAQKASVFVTDDNFQYVVMPMRIG